MKATMKRFLVLIAMLCMTIFAVMLVSACDNCDHDFTDWVQPKNTTCLAPGEKTRTCNICGKVETAKADPVHTWDKGEVTTPATCTEAGIKTFTCTLCGDTKEDAVKRLGHSFSVKYTVDKEATLYEDGWESQHCVRCDETQNGRLILREAQSGITYRIKINRLNGYKTFYYPRIEIYDENNIRTHSADFLQLERANDESTYDSYEYNVIEVSLPLGTYKVYVSNLPDGFEVEEYYILSPETGVEPFDTPEKYPELDIRIESHLREGSMPSVLQVGDVLADYTFNTVNKGTVTLSELLETHTAVIFHFYYNNCPHCVTEVPIFMEVYGKYKDDVAVIAVNRDDPSGVIMSGAASLGYSADFYYVSDYSLNREWTKRFVVEGVPSTKVIDKGGYYAASLGTMSSTAQFETVMDVNVTKMKEALAKETPATVSMELEAVLPERKEYAL